MDTAIPTILIVEDNDRDIQLLRARFREARLLNPVQVVRDGVAAAKYLAGEEPYRDRSRHPIPGIVILDLMLPKMDGFEVLAWIRAREQFNGLPVIVLTAHDGEPMIERARASGADGFLVKGVDIDGLIELLRNAFLGWALLPMSGSSRGSEAHLSAAPSY